MVNKSPTKVGTLNTAYQTRTMLIPAALDERPRILVELGGCFARLVIYSGFKVN